MHAQAARPNPVQRPALHLFRISPGSEIAQPEADTQGDLLAGKGDEARLFMVVCMPDDVGARFIEAEDDEPRIPLDERALG